MDSERDDFRSEIRGALRRIEDTLAATDVRLRVDHDILTKLTEGFEAFNDKADGLSERIGDHEKRIRFLERVAFGMLAIMALIQFWLSKIAK
jgi:hypothetical protein